MTVNQSLLDYLLTNYVDQRRLSLDQTIFESSTITRELMIEHHNKWNPGYLITNSAFLKSSLLDVELFNLLFGRLKEYRLGDCADLLFTHPMMDTDFFDQHINKWDLNDYRVIRALFNHPMMDANFFDRHADKWNWKLLSSLPFLFQHSMLDDNFFARYYYYWQWDELSVNSHLFNHPMMNADFFNKYDKQWRWKINGCLDNNQLIHLIVSHPMTTREFFNHHQLHQYSSGLARSTATFKLPFMDERLFHKIQYITDNEGLFNHPMMNDNFFNRYYYHWNWRKLSMSTSFFDCPLMNVDFFLKYINKWNMEVLAKNIHFFNCSMMSEEDVCVRLLKLMNWRWLSRSRAIFDSNIMTESVFYQCRYYWNWNSVSRNGHLFMSDIMNETFFASYAHRWIWKQLSGNIVMLTHPMVTKEFFDSYRKYKNGHRYGWSMKVMNSKPRIEAVTDAIFWSR